MWLACTTPCTFTHQISYRIRHLIRLRGFGCFYYLFCDFLSVWRFIFFFSGRNFVGLIFVDIHHWHTINCCRDTNVNEINTMFLVYVVMAFHQIKKKSGSKSIFLEQSSHKSDWSFCYNFNLIPVFTLIDRPCNVDVLTALNYIMGTILLNIR